MSAIIDSTLALLPGRNLLTQAFGKLEIVSHQGVALISYLGIMRFAGIGSFSTVRAAIKRLQSLHFLAVTPHNLAWLLSAESQRAMVQASMNAFYLVSGKGAATNPGVVT